MRVLRLLPFEKVRGQLISQPRFFVWRTYTIFRKGSLLESDTSVALKAARQNKSRMKKRPISNSNVSNEPSDSSRRTYDLLRRCSASTRDRLILNWATIRICSLGLKPEIKKSNKLGRPGTRWNSMAPPLRLLPLASRGRGRVLSRTLCTVD